MKKHLLKSLLFVPLMLIGMKVVAQTNASAGTPDQNTINKQVQAQQIADPAVLEKHLETVATPAVVSEPVKVSTSTVTEIDYSRLEGMTPEQRQEILGNPDKYKVINQPK